MPFVPKKGPAIEDDTLENLGSSVTDLALHVEEEFEALASALNTDEEFNTNYKPPTRPRNGMLVYADGTLWNPGSGAGFYQYVGGVWVPLQYTLPANLTVDTLTANKWIKAVPQTTAFVGTPQEGMIVYADGTGWNPGDGEGVYVFKNGAWMRFQDTAPAGTSIDGVSGAFLLGYGITRSSLTLSANLSRNFVALGADVALNNVANYFDGPSVSLGTGTWLVMGTVTLIDTAATARINCKLWDGTTVISSAQGLNNNLVRAFPVSLSGFITNPVGNVRISCQDPDATTGKILFNQTGNSKDSHLTALRVA